MTDILLKIHKSPKPRISTELPRDLMDRYTKTIPTGIKSKVIRIILTKVLDLFDQHGIYKTLEMLQDNNLAIGIRKDSTDERTRRP